MSDMLPAVSRRTFVKATGALGALAAAGGTMAASQAVFSNVEPAHADTPESSFGANVTSTAVDAAFSTGIPKTARSNT